MLNPSPLMLLAPAERLTRSNSSHPRLVRGGPDCRVLTTSEMLAAISTQPPAEQALAALSEAVDRAVALGIAA